MGNNLSTKKVIPKKIIWISLPVGRVGKLSLITSEAYCIVGVSDVEVERNAEKIVRIIHTFTIVTLTSMF